MRRTVIRTAAAAIVVLMGTTGLAGVAAADATSPRANVGYCISDGFYGNQPNEDADGNVIPSQSPGPKRTAPDGTVVEGNSIGDYQRGAALAGTRVSIPMLCQGLFG